MVAICLIIVCHIFLAFGFYLMFRNERVGVFRISLNHILSGFLINYLESLGDDENFRKHRAEYEYLDKSKEYLWNKYTYSQMLFSFKPLRLDKWFTDEEIDFMRQYKQYLPETEKVADEVYEVLHREDMTDKVYKFLHK